MLREDNAMVHENTQTSRYIITARARQGVIQQTRVYAASAVVLARSWQAAGMADVQITDPLGNLLSPEGYRGNFLNGDRRFR